MKTLRVYLGPVAPPPFSPLHLAHSVPAAPPTTGRNPNLKRLPPQTNKETPQTKTTPKPEKKIESVSEIFIER